MDWRQLDEKARALDANVTHNVKCMRAARAKAAGEEDEEPAVTLEL